ncbi:MAG: nicotinate-nucleotide--dimethylbenzimidazole phosphoribosyltransferase [Fibrobacterota bacterium]
MNVKIPPAIAPVKNTALADQIQAHLDFLTKPKGSLGRLEELAMQYCLCRKSTKAAIKSAAVYTFAGDHGITEAGVAPYPKEVTTQMVLNMCGGGAAVSVMARNAGIRDFVVDIGVDYDFPDHPRLVKRTVARGTRNFAKGPAMTGQECIEALSHGFDLAMDAQCDLLGVGEMGIGNSSSASALYSLLLGVDAETTVGAGTGVAGDLLSHKMRVIREAVAFHRTKWDKTPLDALCRVGGFEIAGMAGFMMGGAAAGVPVVVDGFIASAAAAVAIAMAPNLKEYLVFSHQSSERFHAGYLELLGIRPVLDLGMRLGEGTGAVLAMQVIMQAMHCYHEMATFASAGVSEEKSEDVKA